MIKGCNKNILAVALALFFVLLVLIFTRSQAIAENLGFKKTGNYCSPENPGLCAR